MSTEQLHKFPLFDICENYHRGAAASIEANKFIAPKKQAMQLRIMEYITSRGKCGATCHEVERDLKMKHQTASARMSKLKKDFKIFWNGQKRATDGSQPASVFCTSEGQRR